MQTYKLKLPKKDRHAANRSYIKLGIGLIAVLLALNVTFAILFWKASHTSDQNLRILHETGKTLALLQDSLGKTDLQKAFVHLADARRQISVAVSPAPAAPQTKTAAAPRAQPPQAAKAVVESKEPPVQPPAAEPKASTAASKVEPKAPEAALQKAAFAIPVGETPAVLIRAMDGEYALIAEKASKLLHLFQFREDRFVHVKSYPSIIGANGEDKQKAGDFATPKGGYITLRFTPGSSLPEIYGAGAFVLNYPNFLDRKESKKGTGIWIHGHVPGKLLGVGDLINTKGCIAISNENIQELKQLLKHRGTLISIVDRLALVKEGARIEAYREVHAFMDSWRTAWESANTTKYLSHYAKEFINSDGMGYEAFKRYKERVNSSKTFIRVTVDQVAVMFPQQRNGGQVAVVRFLQKYRSNNYESNSHKLFYLNKGQNGWAIFGESAF